MVLLIIFIAAVVLLAFLLLVQRKKRRSSRRSRYIDALYALIKGDKEQALKLLTEAVRGGETDAGAYLTLGNLLRERGQADKALQVHMALQVRRDLKGDEREEVQLAIADDYLETGKIEKAIQGLEQLSRRSRNREVWLRLHKLFHRSGQYDRAFEMLKQLSKQSNDFSGRELASYLTSAAIEVFNSGDKEGAKRFLERALKTDRSCPSAIFFMGKLAMDEGDMGRASDMWKKLLKERMDYFEGVRGYLERSLYEGGDFDAFERMLNDLLQEKPGELSVACALASFYQKKGDIEKAIAVLTEDIQSVHSDYVATILLGSLYLEAGDDSRAREILEKSAPGTTRKIYYSCPECGFKSDYPLFYCTNCFNSVEFKKSYAE